MKYLVGDRGSGISTTLLLECSNCGGVLVVPNRSMNVYLLKCRDMNIKCPLMITFDDVINNMEDLHMKETLRGRRIFIDNLSMLLKEIGLNNVVIVGDSLDNR